MKLALALLAVVLPLAACDGAEPKAQTAPVAAGISDALFAAADFAAEARPVAELKKSAKPGDTVVVRGRIGGTKEPFVAGAAVLALVDAAEPITCGPDDPCPTKWDYCCAEPKELVRASATVKLADASGRPVMASFKGAHGLAEFHLLTVKGKVLAADESNLVIAPTAIFDAGDDADGKKAGTVVKSAK